MGRVMCPLDCVSLNVANLCTALGKEPIGMLLILKKWGTSRKNLDVQEFAIFNI